MNAKNQTNSLNKSRKKHLKKFLVSFCCCIFFKNFGLFFIDKCVHLSNVFFQRSFCIYYKSVNGTWAYNMFTNEKHSSYISQYRKQLQLTHLRECCMPVNMFLSCYRFGVSIFFSNNSIFQNNNIVLFILISAYVLTAYYLFTPLFDGLRKF